MRKIMCFLGFHKFTSSMTFDLDYAYHRESRYCEKCKRKIIISERGNRDAFLKRVEEQMKRWKAIDEK